MRVGSLFSGIGGLDLGLERAGMEIAWQVEIDDYCRSVLARHWPGVRRWGDVRTFPPDAIGIGSGSESRDVADEGRRSTRAGQASVSAATRRTAGASKPNAQPADPIWFVDLICAGFPCQPVSVAGARRGDADDRWLWPETIRVIRTLRPRWALLENVPGLLSADGGSLFGGILRDLAEAGFDAWWSCISAASVGAPHIRDRVFIVAHTENIGCKRNRRTRYRRAGSANGSQARPDAIGTGLEKRNGCGPRQPCTSAVVSDWWATEPTLGCLVDGVPDGLVRFAGRTDHKHPNRVNKLRALGNAVVPAVAEVLGRMIVRLDAMRYHDVHEQTEQAHADTADMARWQEGTGSSVDHGAASGQEAAAE